ncbi:MAG: 50S ribosomal protein L25 [Candidatus Melainabacteria bacterium]|nr:50S ribosomal protein L25 [Candidatus Melainabacteria bacterium]
MAIELQVKPRENKKARALRREGQVPVTLYGPEIEPINLQLDAKEFSHLPFADYTHLINLKQDGQEDHEVLIKEIQRDYVSRDVQSIQFYKVKRGHKVNTKVTLKFVGVSQAVKLGADLVTVHKEAHVKCLPRHIPYSIEVDISSLAQDGDHITFNDLNVNREELEILDPAKEVICKAQTKRKDHTIEATPAEEAAPAEGEEAAAEAPAEGEEKKEEAAKSE